MIQGVSTFTGSYVSSVSVQQATAATAVSESASSSQSVITIERGSSVYETYLRNGVVQKLQYVGSNLSKSF